VSGRGGNDHSSAVDSDPRSPTSRKVPPPSVERYSLLGSVPAYTTSGSCGLTVTAVTGSSMVRRATRSWDSNPSVVRHRPAENVPANARRGAAGDAATHSRSWPDSAVDAAQSSPSPAATNRASSIAAYSRVIARGSRPTLKKVAYPRRHAAAASPVTSRNATSDWFGMVSPSTRRWTVAQATTPQSLAPATWR
jgi:hypothetical protein